MRRWHELPKFTQDMYRERDEQRARVWRNAKARERRAENKRLVQSQCNSLPGAANPSTSGQAET